MAKRKKTPPPLSEEVVIRAQQRAEGLRRTFLEAHREIELHEEARSDAHHLKPQAVKTLELAMGNTGTCGQCGFGGLMVDKTAVQAALGILDRTGLPPVKEVKLSSAKPIQEADIGKTAVSALVVLEADQIGAIVGALVRERPDARPFVLRAVGAGVLVEAAV